MPVRHELTLEEYERRGIARRNESDRQRERRDRRRLRLETFTVLLVGWALFAFVVWVGMWGL